MHLTGHGRLFVGLICCLRPGVGRLQVKNAAVSAVGVPLYSPARKTRPTCARGMNGVRHAPRPALMRPA
jgi:hypothetical protein